MAATPNRSSTLELLSGLARDSRSSLSQETTAPVSPETETAISSPYVLPSDLDSAIKHLTDQELDRLVSAALQERARRKPPPVPNETQRRKRDAEAAAVSLPQGKLNAIRAAFQAGVTPSRIAREFGISRQDVRAVLRGDAGKQ